jgi:hypothetical protein
MSQIVDTEPSCLGETTGQQVWQDAMIEEYHSILKNDVWDIVLRSEEKSIVTSKWIYKIKDATNRSVEARFVARELSHVEGVDYDGTFDLVA